MPQTPPPYANIAGISRADMKDNAQETLVNYDGNARPGELVVDLTTYQLYIGNADGNLNVVSGGGGNGSPGGASTQVQYNNGGAFAGNTQFTFNAGTSMLTVPNMTVNGNILPGTDNVYSLGSNSYQWSDMYVSANTIYISHIPISGNATGLTYNNQPIVIASNTAPAQNSNIATTAAVVAGNLVLSNATPGGGIVFPDGTVQTTAAVTNTYGNANVSAYLASGTDTANIITTGNVIANNFSTTGSANTQSANIANLYAYNATLASRTSPMYIDPLSDGSPITGAVVVLGDMSVTGNLTYNQIAIAATNDLVWAAANNASNAAQASGGGLTVGPVLNPYAKLLYNSTSNEWNANIGISAAGNVTASKFIGDGSLLTNLPGTYFDANVATFLASGNLTSNVVTTANVNAAFFNGNGRYLTGLPDGYSDAKVSTYLASGNNTAGYTTVGAISATGNITTASTLNASTVSATGNVNATGITGTTVTATTLNADVVSATGNITGSYFFGNGAYITGLPAGYTNADAASFLASGTLTTSILTQDNVSAGGNITASGNIAGYYLFGNGSQLTGLAAAYSDADVSAYLASGNNTGGYSTSGDVSANSFIGDGSQLTGLPAGYTNADAAAFLGSYGANNISTSGNITTGRLTVSTLATLGNIANVKITGGSARQAILTDGTGNLSFGNAVTAIEPVYFTAPISGNNQSFSNVVLGGYSNDSTYMSVYRNGALLDNTYYTLSGDTLTVNTLLAATDSISVGAYFSSGAITSVTSGYGNSNVVTLMSAAQVGDIIPAGNGTDDLGSSSHRWGNISLAGNVTAGGLTTTGGIFIGGNANILGTVTYNDVTSITTANLVIGLGNNQSGFNVTGGGIVVGNTAEAQWLYNQPAQTWDSNLGIDATGNITAPYFIGDGSQLTGLPAAYTDADVSTYLASGNNTAGYDTSGNVTAGYFIGDGSQLTGLPASYGNADVATYLASNANVAITTTAAISAAGNVSGNYILGNVRHATGLGNVSAINLNGNGSTFLAGNGAWSTATATAARLDITKVDQFAIGSALFLASGRVFVAKGFASGSNWNNVQTCGVGNNWNGARGINNMYELTFPNETVGTCIDAGTYGTSAYALFANGNLYTWGANTTGQLGIGNTTNYYQPVLSTTNVAQVYTHPSQSTSDANYTRLFIKKNDGAVYGCGNNNFHELGLSSTTDINTWTVLPWIGTNPMSVWNLGGYAGSTIVQKSDGTIWVAGYNGSGQLGVPVSTGTSLVAMDATTAWTGGDNTMVIQAINAGLRYYDGSGWQGYYTISMFLDNGTTSRLVGAGNNNWSSLGNGTATNTSTPTAPTGLPTGVRIRQVIGVGGPPMTLFCLMENNDLYTWGYNGYGQVGNNTQTTRTTPYKVMSNVSRMWMNQQGGVDYGYNCPSPVVVKTDGSFWSWGTNSYYQQGNGDFNTTPQLVPRAMLLPKGLTIKAAGCWSSSGDALVRIIVDTNNKIWAWGYNGQAGIDPTDTGQHYPVPFGFYPPVLLG